MAVGTHHARRDATRLSERLRPGLLDRALRRHRDRLAQADRLLRSYSYQSVLERGFALVRDAEGAMIRSAAAIAGGDRLSIRFADGEVGAVADATAAPARSARKTATGRKKPARPAGKSGDQGDLF